VFAPVVTIEAPIGARIQLRPSPQHRVYTPTQPSPIEGEGYVRFACENPNAIALAHSAGASRVGLRTRATAINTAPTASTPAP